MSDDAVLSTDEHIDPPELGSAQVALNEAREWLEDAVCQTDALSWELPRLAERSMRIALDAIAQAEALLEWLEGRAE